MSRDSFLGKIASKIIVVKGWFYETCDAKSCWLCAPARTSCTLFKSSTCAAPFVARKSCHMTYVNQKQQSSSIKNQLLAFVDKVTRNALSLMTMYP
ncbi:hypothetical protein QLX08_010472 [Tetragonisca angustula]|uniref:Uncharacterized protein n=1 Tax=Tetragonisca angustula TaxID=166442 RepID=A0AAW0ZC50_9HYME